VEAPRRSIEYDQSGMHHEQFLLAISGDKLCLRVAEGLHPSNHPANGWLYTKSRADVALEILCVSNRQVGMSCPR
jgi:hypothetical protein